MSIGLCTEASGLSLLGMVQATAVRFAAKLLSIVNVSPFTRL